MRCGYQSTVFSRYALRDVELIVALRRVKNSFNPSPLGRITPRRARRLRFSTKPTSARAALGSLQAGKP
jgi:hypothetical protein